jgi:hypothetical protein
MCLWCKSIRASPKVQIWAELFASVPPPPLSTFFAAIKMTFFQNSTSPIFMQVVPAARRSGQRKRPRNRRSGFEPCQGFVENIALLFCTFVRRSYALFVIFIEK